MNGQMENGQMHMMHELRNNSLFFSELLQINLLEDLILSASLKHNDIVSPFSLIGEELTEKNKQLLEDIFTRINGLERRLQALAELETKWWSDVEDIAANTREIETAFFYEMQQEVNILLIYY